MQTVKCLTSASWKRADCLHGFPSGAAEREDCEHTRTCFVTFCAFHEITLLSILQMALFSSVQLSLALFDTLSLTLVIINNPYHDAGYQLALLTGNLTGRL